MKIYKYTDEQVPDQYTLDTLGRIAGKDLWVHCILYEDLPAWVSPRFQSGEGFDCYICTDRHFLSYPDNPGYVRLIGRRTSDTILPDEILIIKPAQIVTDDELFTEGANLL